MLMEYFSPVFPKKKKTCEKLEGQKMEFLEVGTV